MMSSMKMDQKDFPEPTSVTDLELGLGPEETKTERLGATNKPKREVIVAVFGIFAVMLIGAIMWTGSEAENVKCGSQVWQEIAARGSRLFRGWRKRAAEETRVEGRGDLESGGEGRNPVTGKEASELTGAQEPCSGGAAPRQQQQEAQPVGAPPQQAEPSRTRKIFMKQDHWEKLCVAKEPVSRTVGGHGGRDRGLTGGDSFVPITKLCGTDLRWKKVVSKHDAVEFPVSIDRESVSAAESEKAVINFNASEFWVNTGSEFWVNAAWEDENLSGDCRMTKRELLFAGAKARTYLKVTAVDGLKVEKGYFMFFWTDGSEGGLTSEEIRSLFDLKETRPPLKW